MPFVREMEDIRYERKELAYEDLSATFKLADRDFNKQYAGIYAVRLLKFQTLLEARVEIKWGKQYEIKKLVDLVPHEKVLVFGIIYKQQELKPSILREVSDEHQLLPLPPKTKYISGNDLLILEDELQRILLVGNINAGDFVTGVVVALLGHEDDSGKFIVEEVCPANMPIMVTPEKHHIDTTRYIAFISGIDLGSGKDSLLLIQEMMFMLMGKTGTPQIQEMMSKVSRLIIAGNSLSSLTQDRDILDKAKYLVRNNMAASIEAVQQLDDIVFQLASSMTVDLMPGAHDPANFVLPQQPLHHCLLPQSSELSTFHAVSNPYSCRIGGRLVMGNSGQPVLDILKNSTLEHPLDAMEKCLEWRHICPTAPDTLGCYPYIHDDPFIFPTCPDIYFAGNQEAFGDRIWKTAEGYPVRLVSLPRFSESGTIVIVDADTTECFTLCFGAEEDSFVDH